MATHQKGYKRIVSGSIDNTLGTILDARHKELGVNKSFEIEQGLKLYYEKLGLIRKNNGELQSGSSGAGNVGTNRTHSFPKQLSTHSSTGDDIDNGKEYTTNR